MPHTPADSTVRVNALTAVAAAIASARPARRPQGSAGRARSAGVRPRAGLHTKRIEDIEVGDSVWAWDEASQATVCKPVVRLFRHQDKAIVTVTLSRDDATGQANLQQIGATTEHPFWVEGKGWVAACQLQAGDLLKRIDGGACLRVVSAELSGTKADVFNFEVEGVHNYFVGRDGVLVHNQSGMEEKTNREGRPQPRAAAAALTEEATNPGGRPQPRATAAPMTEEATNPGGRSVEQVAPPGSRSESGDRPRISGGESRISIEWSLPGDNAAWDPHGIIPVGRAWSALGGSLTNAIADYGSSMVHLLPSDVRIPIEAGGALLPAVLRPEMLSPHWIGGGAKDVSEILRSVDAHNPTGMVVLVNKIRNIDQPASPFQVLAEYGWLHEMADFGIAQRPLGVAFYSDGQPGLQQIAMVQQRVLPTDHGKFLIKPKGIARELLTLRAFRQIGPLIKRPELAILDVLDHGPAKLLDATRSRRTELAALYPQINNHSKRLADAIDAFHDTGRAIADIQSMDGQFLSDPGFMSRRGAPELINPDPNLLQGRPAELDLLPVDFDSQRTVGSLFAEMLRIIGPVNGDRTPARTMKPWGQ